MLKILALFALAVFIVLATVALILCAIAPLFKDDIDD